MGESKVPSQDTFTLNLDTIVQGERVLTNPECQFSYHWDFETNMGLAQLISINGSPISITLHPLGIEGQLDFMSDMGPTHYKVDVDPGEGIGIEDVVIYRVILDIDLETGAKDAAIMFGDLGLDIQSTAGFSEASASKQLAEVELPAQQLEE